MEPVGRRTRRRTEEALIKQCREYKKARPGPPGSDCNTDRVTVLSTSPSASLGSSRSSSSSAMSVSAPVTESATPSPVLRDVEKEVEEEEVSRSFSYGTRGSDRREVEEEDDVEFVSENRASWNSPETVVLSSSSGSEELEDSDEEEEHANSESSSFDDEEDEEEDGSISSGFVEEHVKPHETEDTRSSSSSSSSDLDSEGEMDTKKPDQEEIDSMCSDAADDCLDEDKEDEDDEDDVGDDEEEEEEEEEDDDDDEEEDDKEEIENGGGRVDKKRGGRKVMIKPLTREKNRPLTADEIHSVLINSIVEEANTIVADEPVKKPHEIMDTRSSSNSSDVDSDGEMDTKNPEEEEELDSIYRMMEFCLADDDNNANTASAAAAACPEDDIAKIQEQLCREGKHYLILDEEIGIICKFCSHVREEIKYVIPPFHENPFGVSDRSHYFMYDYQGAKNLPYFEDPNIDSKHFREDAEFDPAGTVWEIIPDIRKTLLPHQREAFEFIWRNVDGGTKIDELMRNRTSEGGGCIISHAPGTGKTRLAIAFLETHMKLYKNSRPVILAPAGILLTWKKEFVKWKVEVPFINLNGKDLSEAESSVAGSLFGKNYEKNLTCMAKRLIKMLCWKKHESVLAISYSLFTQLAQEKKDGTTTSSHSLDQQEKLRDLLLEKPGLLILDEGHMPRNERSLMFKILKEVKTKKRVLLSGTPFQNNFRELYNLLCLVRKEFAAKENPFKKKTSVDEADKAKIREFKEKIKPFYHRYNKYIIDAKTPGLFDNVIYLQPSEVQKMFFKKEEMTKKNPLKANVNMTLISVHPMLLHCKDKNPDFFSQELKNGSWNIDDGAKTRFLIRLIELSSILGEKVLVFSQYLRPLNFLKALLMSEDYFGWREGIEIQFMSGNQDMETRQRTMEYFNKSESEAKVMLASTKACSEGIELTGASRVVLLDVTWNPSVEEQAISRAYRMGQEKFVHVYHLIMTDNDSNRHISQTQKKNFSDYMFLESKKKIGALGSLKADCEDIILERLLEEKIIKEATQERASDYPGPSNGF